MAWTDRLKAAAYTSPSGVRQTFDYEDVSRSTNKKTAGFDFPDANGTYVQDLGRSGRQYPLRMFFWGADYDLEATAFEALLSEQGVGKLEHPAYGTLDVVPFGTINRRDDLKTAANQAVIEVTFWETIGIIYPSAQTDPGSSVLASVDAFNTSAAVQVSGSISVDKAVERSSFKNVFKSALDSAKAGLDAVAKTEDSVRQSFDGIYASAIDAVQTFVGDPLNLVFQAVLLVQAPARAAADISARLSAYSGLASALITGDGASVSPGYDARSSNTFHSNDAFAMAYVTGSVLSAVNATFDTKPQALAAASEVLAQFDAVSAWRESGFSSLGEVDTGEAYQNLQDAVALTAGYLVEMSFSLKQERRITLDRERTVVDLVYELYGSVDDRLDFFIGSNALTGSEILELPRGREVVYYA